MNLPSIYTQPVEGLENFPMNGDHLTVVKDSRRQITENEEKQVRRDE